LVKLASDPKDVPRSSPTSTTFTILPLMRRLLAGAVLASALACGDSGEPGGATLRVSPLLDSLFVGDTAPPGSFVATRRDAGGQISPGGSVRWSTPDPTVIAVDSMTGRVIGVGPGAAELRARVDGVVGSALVVVSRELDIALLIDTIYLMPGDTFTAPVEVRRRGGSPPPPQFAPSPNPTVYTVHATTGLITAISQGGPTRLIAEADSVADTGAVEVVVLTDTTGGGKAYFTVFGTAIRRARAVARALNYARQGAQPTFRLNATITSGAVVVENVVVTLLASVTAAAVAGIDSISPNEAFGTGSDFLCRPARAWALWSRRTASLEIAAVSRAGTIRVTQAATIANGLAISGTFRFDAQRTDFYDEPLGVLAVRGTFVAPVATDMGTCGN
jgi:hypothetical protein